MKKIILLAAFVLPLAFFSCKKDNFGSNPYKGKECVTLDVTNIGPVSATLNGYFDPDTLAHWMGYYFLVCNDKSQCDIDSLINGAPVIVYMVQPPQGSNDVVLPSNHKLKTTADGLQGDTTYFVRALIYCVDTILQKENFIQAENIKSFSTKSLKMNPVTKDATDITPFTAVLNGRLETNVGKDAYMKARFLFGPEGSSLDYLISDGGRTGWTRFEPGASLSYSDTLRYLQPGTTYSYVACTSVSGESYYGEIKTFKTSDLNLTVTALPAEAGPVKAKLKGSISPSCKGSESNEVWFIWGPEGSTLESLKTSGTMVNTSIKDDYTTFEATTTLLEMSKTYCYAAFARVNGIEAASQIASFTTTSRTVPDGTVEMGLSVLWSTKNIGADSPYSAGGYYAWGEVQTKDSYEQSNYKWCNGGMNGANGFTKYNSSMNWGPVVDNKTKLDPEDDIATATLGAPWRMPTSGDWQELIDYCDWVKKEVDGHQVYQITSRLTGQSMFLVSAGYRTVTSLAESPTYYFASDRPDSFTCNAFTDQDGSFRIINFWRHCGTNIRAVRE
ncbi:MAG: hypothetical protein J5771_03295 [Bacteroidales bacterium]|nr:hypothetical protein [Bacteroidales bacterium]